MTIIRWMRRTTTGRCRIWVRLRRTRPEQMSSGLPLKADIAQYGQHLSKVPIVLQKSQTALRLISRKKTKQATIADRYVLKKWP
jgi:hypothetical protein